eukprot:gnl/Hemi2/3786_TR1329_c0_g1_i1.p1 gnl/Hemi2/3786_TR1329_c0_g1~~gnl/Hemi2/3786_TR1329_c0_g1_i1.p1  ORF type:complete len:325 (+),score=83.49 gnl/Hemi2/3786_TR1329_c0_g1_i1:158-1132(+)
MSMPPWKPSFAKPPKNGKSVLDKVVPKNPKFDYIQPSIDTGSSVTKTAVVKEERDMVKARPWEKFRRLSPGTVNKILVEHQTKIVAACQRSAETDPNASPGEFTVSDVVDRKLEAPAIPQAFAHHMPSEEPEKAFLLLDLRDNTEFEAFHLKFATSYPSAMLSRSMNCFTREILEYRNKPNKIIILVDDDERTAVPAGNTMFERDIDNIFVMAGGHKEFCPRFPENVVGTIPVQYRGVADNRSIRSGATLQSRTSRVTANTSATHQPRPPPSTSSTAPSRFSGTRSSRASSSPSTRRPDTFGITLHTPSSGTRKPPSSGSRRLS